MEKQEFIKQVDEIIDFEKKCYLVQNLFNDTICEGSVASVVDFHHTLIESHVKNIAELSGIDTDAIDSFIYASSHGEVFDFKENGETVVISTAEELWDNFTNLVQTND